MIFTSVSSQITYDQIYLCLKVNYSHWLYAIITKTQGCNDIRLVRLNTDK